MKQIPNGLAMAFAFPHLFFFLVFVLPFSAVAQTSGNVTVGTSLSATTNTSSSWLSPSGDFAFGFRSLNNEDLFLLSIWYDKIPEKTTVWYANGDRLAPSESTVQLTADRGLVLNDPQGEEIWRSDPIIGLVAYGVMNDAGNFALKSSNSDSVWESFKNPTDTMLPTQTMERGGTLSSRQTETNFSLGRFQLRFQTDGNLVLRTINLPTTFANAPYYASGTNNESDSLYSGMQVVFNESGFLYILRENDQIFGLTQGELVSARDFYHRATLNFDGVLTQYYHPKTSSGNGNWSVLWSEPENICLDSLISAGSGTCGYNSVCRLNTDRRPICECPRGYSLVDPTDVYGSCKPNFIQSCEEDGPGSAEDLYKFEEMTNTDWPLSDYLQLKPYSEERCKESCLQDCLCSVAIFREGDSCWKKKIPLSNGRVDSKLNGKAFLKIRKDNSTPRNPIFPIPDIKKKKKQDKLIVAGSVLLGSSVFINFILATAICVGFSFIYKKPKIPPQGGSVMETNLRCFNYEELVEATDGFKEELGRGAFGVVYKGAIPMSSSNLVAVKKLDRVIRDGEKEFKTEVAVIGQTHHKNLVRLLGFCNEGPHRLLVYEFLRNGTLASFLFGDLRASWKQRTQIAIGIARGLLYLHEECSTQIIHCDIKPQNILLDDYYNAQISDFGLAKLLMIDQSQTHTGIRGTKGYVAPDWFRNMPITVKVDVYSFGVLLLEVVSCRRCVNMEDSWGEETILTDWAYDCYREGTIDALVSNDMEALNDIEKLKRFVMVAIWCIQEDPSLRPTMRKITQMLEGVVEVNVPPCPSPFNTIC